MSASKERLASRNCRTVSVCCAVYFTLFYINMFPLAQHVPRWVGEQRCSWLVPMLLSLCHQAKKRQP
jgi:hypothetical protein